MYGQPKVIAKRTPLIPKSRSTSAHPSGSNTPTGCSTSIPDSIMPEADILSTPTATEGETATETDLDTETETEIEEERQVRITRKVITRKVSKHQSTLSTSSVSSNGTDSNIFTKRSNRVSHHDLLNKYFRRDAVVLRNIDFLR